MLSILLGVACFTPPADPLAIEKIAFANDYTDRDDLVLQPFHYDGLTCPDGEPATFYALYAEDLDPSVAAPIVIVFHAGAFDYVEARADGTVPAFDSSDAVFYSGENRFSSDWAADKVFETLGLLDEVIDPTETNLGILPAKLANAGTFSVYPANCWGDLWHNETGARNNNWEADGGVHRDGRYLAWVMTAIANPDPEIATSKRTELGLDALPISLDASGVYIVGLGEGGRAAAELRARDILNDVPNQSAALIKGMVVDSHLDDLYRIAAHDELFPEVNDGLARLYPDHDDDDGDGLVYGDVRNDNGIRDDIEPSIYVYSLANALKQGALTYPLGVWYSSADPQVPSESNMDLLGYADDNPDLMTVVNYGDALHTILNRDEDQANEAVRVLLGR